MAYFGSVFVVFCVFHFFSLLRFSFSHFRVVILEFLRVCWPLFCNGMKVRGGGF